MNVLAIDTSALCISFTACKGDNIATHTTSTRKQSEVILECIQTVLTQVSLETKDLHFTALASGPGSFTGLRLAYATLKALEVAHNIPIYGVPTLAAIAHPYLQGEKAVVAVLDAKKEKFYTSVFREGKEVIGPIDASVEHILEHIDAEEEILVCGDAELFAERLAQLRPTQAVQLATDSKPISEQVLEIAINYHTQGVSPIADYDGPVYIRKSEAEESLDSALKN